MSQTQFPICLVIRQRRIELDWSQREVSTRAGINEKTYPQYESNRQPSAATAKKIRKTLFDTPEALDKLNPGLAAEFDRCMSSSKLAHPLDLPFDDPKAILSVCPLTYPPFSGGEPAFVDDLIKKLCEHAVLKFDEPVFSQVRKSDKRFDVERRIGWVLSGQTHVIMQLCSLMRMKRLRYMLTPIRVSLNAVVLRKEAAYLQEIQTLFSTGDFSKHKATAQMTFCAVENEVAHIHLVQNLKVAPGSVKTFETLDPETLANKMIDLDDNGEQPILACDEITCMAVVRELKGAGMLVLQPATEDSVLMSSRRRRLPAHPFGVAASRKVNAGFFDYLSEAMEVFLAYETETVAQMLELLYLALVQQVKECLSQDGALYLSGVRRVPMDQLGGQQQFFADLNARAFARRCLQVSRASLQALSPELRSWKRALRRSRERILIEEAKDRTRIRASVVVALKNVLGLDPLDSNASIPEQRAKDNLLPNWAAFRYVLERDLDVEISPEDTAWYRKLERLTLEVLVSDVQHALESSGQTPSITYVALMESKDAQHFESAWQKYLDEAHPPGTRSRDALVAKGHSAVAKVGYPVFLAFNLGVPVGFLATTRVRDTAKPDLPPGESLHIDHVYIPDYMRGSGMTRRLFRRAIEFADAQELAFVWMNPRSEWIRGEARRRKLIRIFKECGFVEGPGGILKYEINRFLPDSLIENPVV